MKIVVNKTHQPIHLALGGGHILHLEPHGRGQVSDSSVESRSVRALLDAGQIEILAAGRSRPARPAANLAIGTRTHGHHPPVSGKRRGNR